MNDKSTSSSAVSTERSNLAKWDTRLHQLFSLVVPAYVLSTWVAPSDISLVLASVLYVVIIPSLVVFHEVADNTNSKTPISGRVIGVILLAASLTWAFSKFITGTPDWVETVPIAFVFLSLLLLSWNTIRLNFKTMG